MSAEELDGIVRRRLVVIAVDNYDDGQEGFTEAVAAQVERITGWLADPELGDDRRFEVVRAEHSPRSVDDLRAFLHGQKLAAATYKEAVVVYVTGHGLRRLAQRHYLMLPATDEERLLATGFPTSELITAVLDSQSEHVMVLVDSCHSGTLRAELASMFQDLSDERHSHKGTAVVTAGDHYEKPLVGSFTRRVSLAYERMCDEASGYTGSHLSFAEFEQLLHQVGLDEDGTEKALVSAEWIVPHSRGGAPSACLPNPRFRPVQSAAGPALRQLALGSASLEEFWLERASGRAGEDDPGWYFSGRAEPMARMVSFTREGAGVLVVTGAAGSGKSALLARLVTLADAGFTADPRYAAVAAGIPSGLRPDPGAVDVAVLARNKSARVVVEELLAALGGAPSGGELPLQSLLGLLSTRASGPAGTVSVVIDALDEAEDPLACVGDVVIPLSRLAAGGTKRAVRLVVGVRSSPSSGGYASDTALRDERADQLLQRLDSALRTEGVPLQVLRTDGPDCTSDIAAYTAALLSAPRTSPYHGAPEAADTAARHIAQAVAPSFLDARIAAEQLRTADTCQDLDETGWLRRLADGTTGLLREDIQAVASAAGADSGLLVAALRATAFAPGAGLPWAEVWPAVTVALASEVYGPGFTDADAADHAIRILRSSRLTGYLASAEEDARAVYRPVHQRLTDLLLAGGGVLLAPAAAAGGGEHPDGPHTLAAAHSAIVRALAELVEQALPHPAHPYVRRYLLHHADAGGVLTDVEVPVALLAQESSGTLRARLALPLPAGDPERQNLTAAALIEPFAVEATDYASRLGSIAFLRAVRGLGGEAGLQADALAGLPVRPLWGRWAARVNVLAPAPGQTKALCVVPTSDGRQLAASAADAGGVRVWDARTGQPVADLATGTVHRMCTIMATGGRTFLVTAGQSDTGQHEVRIFDPVSGQPIARTPVPQTYDVHVLADGPALWKLLILTRKGTFLWRPRAGRLFEVPDFPEGIAQRHSQVWAPARWQPSLTAVVRSGSGKALVAVCGGEGIRLWDPASAATVSPSFGGSQVSGLVGVARPDRDDLLIAESPNPLVPLRVWNPFTLQQVASSAEGGSKAVAGANGTAFAYVARNRIVMQGLDGGAVRTFEAETSSVDALAVAEGPAGPRVMSAGPEGIRVWGPGPGGPLYEDGLAESVYRGPSLDQRQRSAPTWSLCRSSLPVDGETQGGDVLVLATRSGLDIHSATTGRLLKRIGTGLVGQVLPLAPDRARVAVSAPNGDLSIWDLVSGQSVMTSRKELSQSALSSCVAWTAEGLPVSVSLAATGGDPDLTTVVLDHENGRSATRTVPLSTDSSKSAVRLLGALPPSPSGDIAVVAGVGRDLALIDVASGGRAGTLSGLDCKGGHGSVLCTLPGASGPLLAVSNGTDIGVWDVTTLTQVTAWKSPDTFTMTGLSVPGGPTLLVSGGTGGVGIWNPRTGGLIHTVLTGAPVHGITVDRGAEDAVLHLYGPAGLATVSVDTGLL
ncbi:AAA family ATPase [Kitasatospora sp. NPDC028055]|uniref:AAA family ATPase n=1 Tax=Kitasatospora sp. NPDC028055 TaxID=3155653 RepID=UPI0033DE4029